MGTGTVPIEGMRSRGFTQRAKLAGVAGLPSATVTVALGRLAAALGGLAVTLGLALALGLSTASAAAAPSPGGGDPQVLVTEIATEITPVVADQVDDGVARAESDAYDAYVIQMDTPGGLQSSMRAIVQDILASSVPVIVYVAPEGARAASAGAVIALSAHVVVMAPGTAMGAATPVGLQGGDVSQKIIEDSAAYAESLAELRGRNVELAGAMVREGRSVPAEQAVERNVADSLAGSLDEALAAADGRTVEVDGGSVTVTTEGATVDRFDLGLFREVQQFLANPNLAFILLALGALGLIFELASPGVGIAGTVGAVSLVLALFSLAILPVNVVGLLLLGLSMALFVAELLAPGTAGFAIGGAVTLVLAALFLFDDAEGVEVDPVVAIPVAAVLAGFAIIAGRLVVRAQRGRTTRSGEGVYTGRIVTAEDVPETDPTRGRAFVEGSWWKLRSTGEPLHDGDQAEVVDVDGLTLVVEPQRSQSDVSSEERKA